MSIFISFANILIELCIRIILKKFSLNCTNYKKLKKVFMYNEDILLVIKQLINKSNHQNDGYTIYIKDSKVLDILSEAFNRYVEYDILAKHKGEKIGEFIKDVLNLFDIIDIDYVVFNKETLFIRVKSF